MDLIPIADTATQSFTVTLTRQSCSINLYQRSSGFYCDVYVNNTLVIGGVVCENLNRIVRDKCLGFVGDVFFYDTQGTDNPSFPGLGTRFQFLYEATL